MTLGDRMTAPARQSGPAAINQFNAYLKQQPWYQQFFAQRGIDPQAVKLSRHQQGELEQLMAAHGVPIGSGTTIDDAGNVNEKNRLSRAAIIAAPIAASMFIPGVREAVLSHAGALFGGGGSGTAVSASAAPTVAAGTSAAAASAPAIASAVAPAAVKTGFSIGSAFSRALPSLVNAGANLYATHAATSANRDAAAVQAQTTREALDYTKQHDAQQRQDDLAVQNRNYALFQEAQARLDPYRQFGQQSLAMMGRPIPGVGTLGARAGGY